MASRENPVTWLLGNRELLALLFVAVAWVAQKLGLTRKKEAAAARGRAEASASSEAGVDEAERTRRVQEDVRRKIAERRAGAGTPVPPPMRLNREPAPPLVAPRPIASSPGGRLLREMFPTEFTRIPTPPPPTPDDDLEEVLARQRGLEEKMRQLQTSSAAASANAGGISLGRRIPSEASSEASAPSIPYPSPYAWISQLRDPQSARRAIVLREVLGPPVAFR